MVGVIQSRWPRVPLRADYARRLRRAAAGEGNNSVAGIMNFMRNIGASVGTSLVTTMIARRSQVHQVDLAAHTYDVNPSFRQVVAARACASHGAAGPGRVTAPAYSAILSACSSPGDDAGLHGRVFAARRCWRC